MHLEQYGRAGEEATWKKEGGLALDSDVLGSTAYCLSVCLSFLSDVFLSVCLFPPVSAALLFVSLPPSPPFSLSTQNTLIPFQYTFIFRDLSDLIIHSTTMDHDV